VLRSLASGQHRDSAILSTSGEIASAVRAVGQLHCEAWRAYDEPADWRRYEDEIRSVEGPRCYARNRLGGGPEGTAPATRYGPEQAHEPYG
jgi:hypothetical protein